jgi:putative transposase
MDLAHVPQHVVQRSNDHQPCFTAEEDYTSYLSELADAAVRCRCEVHAYVLMTDHVHLLVTGAKRGDVSHMMQCLGRGYVAGFNARRQRTGTLWESRFKSSLVDSQRYLFACHRYIERDPLRKAMVTHPAEYRWSSYRSNALGESSPLVSPHPMYLQLGSNPATRQAAYCALLAEALSEEERATIRIHVQQQKALGTPHFQTKVAGLLARSVVVRPCGRPRLDDEWWAPAPDAKKRRGSDPVP